MSQLDTHDIDSLVGATYFIVGRGTEGGPVPYHLTIAGITAGKSDPSWGSISEVAANSGYSLGTIQVDLGQRGTWALGATSGAPLRSGETTYVDAIIEQASRYAAEHDLTFTHDSAQLRTDLLSHGNGLNGLSSLSFIDTDTRDSINAWAGSEGGQRWIHKNIDYPQVKQATKAALDLLDKYGKNVSEDHRLETIAILAKTANQRPKSMADFKAVLEKGGNYEDVLAEARDIHKKHGYYVGSTAAEFAEKYKSAYKDPTTAAAIDRAHAKVGDTNFDPSKASEDPDIDEALKAIDQGSRTRVVVLRQGDQGKEVRALQTELAQLGYKDLHGHALNPDGDFGPSTRHAVKAFQHDHGLSDDGVAGNNTSKALREEIAQHTSLQQSALQAITMDHPQHPGYPMFQQSLACVGKLDEAQGRATDFQSYNLSGVLALAAKREGLERIDQVVLSDDATRAIAVQGDLCSPLRRLADVDVLSGVNTPLAQSSTDWTQLQPPAQTMQAPSPLIQTPDVQAAQPAVPR